MGLLIMSLCVTILPKHNLQHCSMDKAYAFGVKYSSSTSTSMLKAFSRFCQMNNGAPASPDWLPNPERDERF